MLSFRSRKRFKTIVWAACWLMENNRTSTLTYRYFWMKTFHTFCQKQGHHHAFNFVFHDTVPIYYTWKPDKMLCYSSRSMYLLKAKADKHVCADFCVSTCLLAKYRYWATIFFLMTKLDWFPTGVWSTNRFHTIVNENVVCNYLE